MDADPTVAERFSARMRRLYPLCRSISGNGVRSSLQILGEDLPALDVVEVPSGARACDWVVGDEWNIRDAYIADPTGARIVDFQQHNLHVVGYSVPFRAELSLEALRPHLHTLPDRPSWIPYRTAYYTDSWGFCLAHQTLDTMGPGPYQVVIDSERGPGSLTYGELLIPGASSGEVLFSAHVCHPSLANDNLSGMVVAAELARLLGARERLRYSYRFLFAPGTIGALAWLERNAAVLPHIRHGLVLTGLGGPGGLVYKQTRNADRRVDVVAAHVVNVRGGEVRAYSPYGYDERQFNAIGFSLPVGRLSRTPHGEYPEYHTSADDLSFVRPDQLVASLDALLEFVDVLEADRCYVNLSPFGEPQLGARGLYPAVGGQAATDAVMAMLWVLAYSDGQTGLLDIARRSGLAVSVLDRAASTLADAGLLQSVAIHERPETVG